MWIVKTSMAHMPNSCWGRYRNVALMKLRPSVVAGWVPMPQQISARHRGVARLIHLGHHHAGKTERCALQRVLRDAHAKVLELNTRPDAEAELLATWGGSA